MKKSAVIFGFSICALSCSIAAFAGLKLKFRDQVKAISLSRDGARYDVTFMEHAAYYHVAKGSPALKCLNRSIDHKSSVSVLEDAQTLVILSCKETR